MDTVRRDAARCFLRFDTRYTPQNPTAEVRVELPHAQLTYTINMENDLIDKIAFSIPAGPQKDCQEGILRFSYLQQIDNTENEFVEPEPVSYGGSSHEAPGILWLDQLINGTLAE